MMKQRGGLWGGVFTVFVCAGAGFLVCRSTAEPRGTGRVIPALGRIVLVLICTETLKNKASLYTKLTIIPRPVQKWSKMVPNGDHLCRSSVALVQQKWSLLGTV